MIRSFFLNHFPIWVMLLLGTAIPLSAQDVVVIADKNLENYLIGEWDANDDHRLDSHEAKAVFSLTLTKHSVADLSGLEAFSNLEYLDLSNNLIVDLGPVARLAHLSQLNLNGNLISDASALAGLAKLGLIHLRDNRIADLSPLLALDSLIGSQNTQHHALMDLEKNLLTESDCDQLLGLGNMGFRILYEDQKTGRLSCVDLSNRARRWIAHVTSPTGGFETSVTLTNRGRTEGALILQPYNKKGKSMDPRTIVLAPNSFQVMDVVNLFEGQQVSHFSVEGRVDCTVTTGYRSQQGACSTAHVNDTDFVRHTFYLFSGGSETVFDGAALVNLGQKSATITGRLIDASGSVVFEKVLFEDWQPYEKKLIVFGAEFPEPGDKRMSLTSSQPAVALFLRGPHDQTGAAVLYQTDETLVSSVMDQNRRWLLHLTPWDAQYHTRVTITNPTDTTGSIRLSPYTASGNTLDVMALSLGPGQSRRLETGDLDAAAAHFSIEGDDFVTVTAAYKAVFLEGGSAHVGETTQFGNAFSVFPGEWDRVWDGAALVNPGDRPIEIVIAQLDALDNELSRKPLTSMPKSKTLINFSTLFPNQAGTRISVRGDGEMGLLFLRGSIGAGSLYLFQTQSIVE